MKTLMTLSLVAALLGGLVSCGSQTGGPDTVSPAVAKLGDTLLDGANAYAKIKLAEKSTGETDPGKIILNQMVNDIVDDATKAAKDTLKPSENGTAVPVAAEPPLPSGGGKSVVSVLLPRAPPL